MLGPAKPALPVKPLSSHCLPYLSDQERTASDSGRALRVCAMQAASHKEGKAGWAALAWNCKLNYILATASSDGAFSVWDLRKQKPTVDRLHDSAGYSHMPLCSGLSQDQHASIGVSVRLLEQAPGPKADSAPGPDQPAGCAVPWLHRCLRLTCERQRMSYRLPMGGQLHPALIHHQAAAAASPTHAVMSEPQPVL